MKVKFNLYSIGCFFIMFATLLILTVIIIAIVQLIENLPSWV